jgi:hypothetical protein
MSQWAFLLPDLSEDQGQSNDQEVPTHPVILVPNEKEETRHNALLTSTWEDLEVTVKQGGSQELKTC